MCIPSTTGTKYNQVDMHSVINIYSIQYYRIVRYLFLDIVKGIFFLNRCLRN